MSEPTPPTFSFRFELDYNDYSSYYELHEQIDPEYSRSWRKFRHTQRWMFLLATVAAVWCFYALRSRDPNRLESPGLLSFVGFGVFVYLWWWCLESIRRNLPRQLLHKREAWARSVATADQLGSRELTLSPAGMRRTARHSEFSHDWAGVPSIYETPTCIVIPISRGSAVMLPKRVFESKDSAAALLQTIRAWHDAANPGNEGLRLRNLLADRDAPCPKCGYNLRGIKGQQCPECGRILDSHSVQLAMQSPPSAFRAEAAGRSPGGG